MTPAAQLIGQRGVQWPRQESARWPHYAATATDLWVAGVAGIPMRDGDEVIGALNIYSREPREWSDEDIAVAVVLADVATGYVLNAAKAARPGAAERAASAGTGLTGRYRTGQGDHRAKEVGQVDHAYQLMRGHASSNHASLRTLAEAIVGVGLQV